MMASIFSQWVLAGTAAGMLAATPAWGEPPAPANAWTIDYSETRCTARRSFEDNGRALTIAIRPSLEATSYEVTISRPGGEYQLPMQIMGTADFGHGAAKHWVLKHRNPTDSSQVYRFQVPATALVPPAASGKISFAAEEYRARVDGVDLAAAIGALDTCLKDLRNYWNESST
jgi:hypothetical protein